MLTHMHMVVYTWWCWHIYKGGGVPRVERGLGSSLLRKLSVYFLLRRWEFWRSRGSVNSSDAGVGSTGRWSRASGVVSVAQVCTERTGVSPVLSVRCTGGLVNLSTLESGEHRTLPVACVR